MGASKFTVRIERIVPPFKLARMAAFGILSKVL